MGQVLDKFHGKQWRQKEVRLITDKVYERVKNQSGRANLTFEDLYIAVLLVYNDIKLLISVCLALILTHPPKTKSEL